ncbi:right-handed parallel beta-helix repeat-containing protein [Paenibacillus planticolens]|uniref:Right-handed parallel beta-helix repeat-containing protein n=1 Tax=Paenibacillus planticolens TaxID=2654976 RepID=A0ABX1ZJE7_9BACL|nr:right-handed parallel beta-helix repeat-containing protein [Paenibacillus planticolens]NOV00209.1 right-handed parallel beta-helix repeat-containing protein [Paenibacillus planticolens]
MIKKAIILLTFFMLSFQSLLVEAVTLENSTQAIGARTYNLELSRWNVYNDGTHPVETTNGINKALQWASEQGYQIFKVPAGRYLISKGTKPDDSQARINMVSNMTFLLDDLSIIQKETNSYENYRTLYVGYGVNNATIKGGTYQGDKETHNYSSRDNADSAGTHEFGSGISSEGSYNLTIDDVKIINFTGDGITIAGSNIGISGTYGKDYLYGDIDGSGKFINSTSKIRPKNAMDFTSPSYKGRKYFAFEQPQGVTNNRYDVYFYKNDGTYLSSVKQVRFGMDLVQIPQDAKSFYPVFSSNAIANFFVKLFSNDVSRNITIRNSELAFNRRQGISIFGVDGIEISNNKIHDIKGTAPGFGIDSEAEGFFPNNNLNIMNNHFYNNRGGDIVFADGDTALISNNKFESSIGVYIYSAFPNTTVKSNTFTSGGLTMGGTGVADLNTFINAEVNLSATSNTLTNSTFLNSRLTLKNTDSFGSKVENITMTNTDSSVFTSLNVGDRPVQLSNITIQGVTKLSTLGGKGTDQNVYNNLRIEDYNAYNGTSLPAGTYNNCQFSSATNELVGLAINQTGTYAFNNCSFHALGKIFTIYSLFGEADITISNSNFNISKDVGYAAALYVQGAKQLSILNSTLTANNLTLNNTPYIKIGSLGGSTKPTEVNSFTFKNNSITTSKALYGIDSMDAGTGAPAYTISNNIFNIALLKLKTNDLKQNNEELSPY